MFSRIANVQSIVRAQQKDIFYRLSFLKEFESALAAILDHNTYQRLGIASGNEIKALISYLYFFIQYAGQHKKTLGEEFCQLTNALQPSNELVQLNFQAASGTSSDSIESPSRIPKIAKLVLPVLRFKNAHSTELILAACLETLLPNILSRLRKRVTTRLLVEEGSIPQSLVSPPNPSSSLFSFYRFFTQIQQSIRLFSSKFLSIIVKFIPKQIKDFYAQIEKICHPFLLLLFAKFGRLRRQLFGFQSMYKITLIIFDFILSKIVPFLIPLHTAIFYLNGKYPTISRRLIGLHFLSSSKSMNFGGHPVYTLLGILMSIQLLFPVLLSIHHFLSQRMFPLRENRTVENQNDSCSSSATTTSTQPQTTPIPEKLLAPNCPLCLSPRIDPASLRCGHIYCWNCIQRVFSSQETQKVCPLCRDPIIRRDIVKLHGYL